MRAGVCVSCGQRGGVKKSAGMRRRLLGWPRGEMPMSRRQELQEMWNKAREARDRRPSDVLSVEKIVADELHEWELLEKADLPGPEQTRAEIQALLKRQTGLDLPGCSTRPA